jgi:hypothetical protein
MEPSSRSSGGAPSELVKKRTASPLALRPSGRNASGQGISRGTKGKNLLKPSLLLVFHLVFVGKKPGHPSGTGKYSLSIFFWEGVAVSRSHPWLFPGIRPPLSSISKRSQAFFPIFPHTHTFPRWLRQRQPPTGQGPPMRRWQNWNVRTCDLSWPNPHPKTSLVRKGELALLH